MPQLQGLLEPQKARLSTSPFLQRAETIDGPIDTSDQSGAERASSDATSQTPTVPAQLGRAGPKRSTGGRLSLEGQPLRPQDEIKTELVRMAIERDVPVPPALDPRLPDVRMPRSVQALYLAPLRRTPTHGIPVANLQMRSYSIRNLELMADFAMRAAYYLDLPAKGPVPLPRLTERWTVPRSHFIFKKSQENFERVTLRRLIQIQDGDSEVVRRWLGFVRKWCWYGVGMKCDVFEFEDTEVVERMDHVAATVASKVEGIKWETFGRMKGYGSKQDMEEVLDKRGFPGPPPPSITSGRARKQIRAA